LRATVGEFAEQCRRDPADTRLLLRAKDAFYDTLVEGAGSEVLKQLLGGLQARVRLLRATSLGATGRPTSTAAELGAVMDAVERRDGETAAELCVQHVRNASATALRNLA
jgi:DNA-binding GntR family transcriptional regulator